MFGEAEFADHQEDISGRDQQTLELTAFLRRNFRAFSEIEFADDGNLRYQQMGKFFTFMFR